MSFRFYSPEKSPTPFIRDIDDLPFIILLVFTLGSFTEEDDNAEDDNLRHYSHEGVEGGQGVLDPQQDLLLVAVLVLGHVALLCTLPGQHSLAHVVLPVLSVGGGDGQPENKQLKLYSSLKTALNS